MELADIDPNVHVFAIAPTQPDHPIVWTDKFLEAYHDIYNKPPPTQDLLNKEDILSTIKILYPYYAPTKNDTTIIILDKRYAEGIDKLEGMYFFNSYKYIVSKLKKIVTDINISWYLQSMTMELEHVQPKYIYSPGAFTQLV